MKTDLRDFYYELSDEQLTVLEEDWERVRTNAEAARDASQRALERAKIHLAAIDYERVKRPPRPSSSHQEGAGE